MKFTMTGRHVILRPGTEGGKSRDLGRIRDEADPTACRKRIAAINSEINSKRPGSPGRPCRIVAILKAQRALDDVLARRGGLATGERLAAARMEAGLKQVELASRCGFSQSTIADWERGRFEPTLANIRAIADACGVSVADLVG
jgi:DNA-binding XRE family transcriptional regulator